MTADTRTAGFSIAWYVWVVVVFAVGTAGAVWWYGRPITTGEVEGVEPTEFEARAYPRP